LAQQILERNLPQQIGVDPTLCENRNATHQEKGREEMSEQTIYVYTKIVEPKESFVLRKTELGWNVEVDGEQQHKVISVDFNTIDRLNGVKAYITLGSDIPTPSYGYSAEASNQ